MDVIYFIKKINEKNQIIISIKAEKYLKKIAPTHDKFLSKLRIEGNFILIKGNHKKTNKINNNKE